MVFTTIFFSLGCSPREEENEEISLMTMPDLVMTKILDDVDFKDIIKLRKVCRGLRNSIDHLRPYKLTGLNLDFRPSRIHIILSTHNGSEIELDYAKYGDHCVISTRGNENHPKLIRNTDYMEVFENDISGLLRNQKSLLKCVKIQGWPWNAFYSPLTDGVVVEEDSDSDSDSKMEKWKKWILEYFGTVGIRSPSLEYSGVRLFYQLEKMNKGDVLTPAVIDRFFNSLARILQNLPTRIQMTELNIRLLKESHLANLPIDFSHMDTLIINRIHLKSPTSDERFRSTKRTMNVVTKLKNWERIRQLDVVGFKVSVPIRNFLAHKSIMELSVPSISVDDIVAMKEYLLTATHLKTYTILYDHLEDADRLDSALGPFFHHIPTGKHWFFRIPDSDLVLFVSQDHYNQGIAFERGVKDYIPKRAKIQ